MFFLKLLGLAGVFFRRNLTFIPMSYFKGTLLWTRSWVRDFPRFERLLYPRMSVIRYLFPAKSTGPMMCLELSKLSSLAYIMSGSCLKQHLLVSRCLTNTSCSWSITLPLPHTASLVFFKLYHSAFNKFSKFCLEFFKYFLFSILCGP